MPNCLCCFHCGFCGPEAKKGQVKRNPPGYCVFCKTQNDETAARCAQCGRPLPRTPGLVAEAGSADTGA